MDWLLGVSIGGASDGAFGGGSDDGATGWGETEGATGGKKDEGFGVVDIVVGSVVAFAEVGSEFVQP
ncbi:hypothetical protein IV203_010311 [Nitzschia inconspicua]|uniref:Uncharacterized protein n=1 Tax=Nitzschia inconspicua TaxID=303405 RepID=A0A9K3PLA8_9STRA|nr:hypothetical protein IV203_010311 [Nitzschia inconspicua]